MVATDDTRVGIAMSGGVDSTATAILLKPRYRITGFFMRLAQPDLQRQQRRVTELAERIGIELRIIDLAHEFEREVLEYFRSSYFMGVTPNPCVICNREIKFGLFLQTLLDHGMEMMATGHYARLVRESGRVQLLKGLDPGKDQTYFLSRLRQSQLSRLLFPLGGNLKEETYRFVESHGFLDFRGKESQDVCFLGDTSVREYLAGGSDIPAEPGPIVDTEGRVLGHHSGICHYTVGQRKGLGISSEKPLYVIELKPATNSVIVGSNEELFKSVVTLSDIHWLSGTPPATDREYTARIRYTHPGCSCRLSLHEDFSGEVIFSSPQRAVTPGQFCVIYDNEELLGSGIITGGRK